MATTSHLSVSQGTSMSQPVLSSSSLVTGDISFKTGLHFIKDNCESLHQCTLLYSTRNWFLRYTWLITDGNFILDEHAASAVYVSSHMARTNLRLLLNASMTNTLLKFSACFKIIMSSVPHYLMLHMSQSDSGTHLMSATTSGVESRLMSWRRHAIFINWGTEVFRCSIRMDLE